MNRDNGPEPNKILWISRPQKGWKSLHKVRVASQMNIEGGFSKPHEFIDNAHHPFELFFHESIVNDFKKEIEILKSQINNIPKEESNG